MSGLTKKIIAIAGASAFVSGAALAADLTVVSWGEDSLESSPMTC